MSGTQTQRRKAIGPKVWLTVCAVACGERPKRTCRRRCSRSRGRASNISREARARSRTTGWRRSPTSASRQSAILIPVSKTCRLTVGWPETETRWIQGTRRAAAGQPKSLECENFRSSCRIFRATPCPSPQPQSCEIATSRREMFRLRILEPRLSGDGCLG